jgi:hypothetical protein
VASEDLRDRLASAGVRNLHVLGRGVDGDLFSPRRRSTALRQSWGAAEWFVKLVTDPVTDLLPYSPRFLLGRR